jgi:predicted ATPase
MGSAHMGRPQYHATGYQMIRSIEIRNFRCFKHLKLENVSRLNVIVGDNGVGKTTLLESIFLPLSATTKLALRYRAQRGLPPTLTGSRRQLEDAVLGDLFHEYNYDEPVRIELTGDGPEQRSLTISRSISREGMAPGGISMTYKDSTGIERIYFLDITKGESGLPDTGEDLPGFQYYSANTGINALEAVGRFSELSRARKQGDFVEVFAGEYSWLEDIGIEVTAGAPALYGTLKTGKSKVALPNISGGINRMVAILVSIASRTQSIVLVDEIENGVYYKRQPAFWRGILKFLRQHDGQMIAATHSKECLEALIEAAGDKLDDIALWRLERGPDGHEVLQFSGDTLKAGIEHDVDIRSPDDSDD